MPELKKVRVNDTSIIVYKDKNYYGGQELSIPENVYEKVKENVDVIDQPTTKQSKKVNKKEK